MAGVRLRTCPLCEATCGLEITVGDGAVEGSAGTPRTFQPRVPVPEGRVAAASCTRTPTGCARRSSATRRRLAPGVWDEAFAEIDRRLPGRSGRARPRRGRPSTSATRPRTTWARCIYGRVAAQGARTRNLFGASTVDQYPKQLASALMFGSGADVAVPDLDRTDHLLVLGANPLASNGSAA